MALRIYLDSNVFIAIVERNSTETTELARVLQLVEQGRGVAFTSELTLAKVLVIPYAEKDEALARTYLDLIASTDVMRVPAVDREILIRAAQLRSQRKSLRLPDAIHLATAELADC